MVRVYLSLGSNLGNRHKSILEAIKLIKKEGIRIKKISSVIETDPVGPPQGKFLNAVLEIETDYPPRKLLLKLKQIEKTLGRKKTVRFGPRKIDLDILLYSGKRVRLPGLVIPHPRMLERDFVMRPLKQIAPKIFQNLVQK
ncbi:MAG: 2-amino-4-hydroxy-6-hydroxymethyldihydropteridine diphosphokinase [Candidatus Omnitrophota bacterium]